MSRAPLPENPVPDHEPRELVKDGADVVVVAPLPGGREEPVVTRRVCSCSLVSVRPVLTMIPQCKGTMELLLYVLCGSGRSKAAADRSATTVYYNGDNVRPFKLWTGNDLTGSRHPGCRTKWLVPRLAHLPKVD